MKTWIPTLLLTLATLPTAAHAGPSACDLTADGSVDVFDLVTMLGVIQGDACPRHDCDLDADGAVTTADYQRVLNDVLAIEACVELPGAADLLGPGEAIGVIDVDVDGDLDFFLDGTFAPGGGKIGAPFAAAFDLDGDGTFDLVAPVEGLAIDLDGDWAQPWDWFGVRPDGAGAPGPVDFALAVDAGVPAEAFSSSTTMALDLDGDALGDVVLSYRHLVGELF